MKSTKFSDLQYGVMRTAFLTAFPKIFTDIEYSESIFLYMKKLSLSKGFSFSPELFNNQMSLEIEARHKALNNELKKYITKDTLVIEIAAGLSPRRLQFIKNNYIEMDFEPIIDIKRDIYKKMKKPYDSLVSVDLSNKDEFQEKLEKIVNKKRYSKIIILNEGLFWYLTKEEILQMANVIKSALTSKEWLWITSDCPVESKIEDDYRKVISDSAKVKRGTFSGYSDFTTFFEQIGFKNKSYSLPEIVEYSDLLSAKLFSINKEDSLKRMNAYTNIAVIQKK